MNYCENCGSQLEDGHQFCEACGVKVGESVVEKNDTTITKENPSKKIEIKELTKQQKTIALGILAAIIVLFLGYNLGKSIFSEENQREAITEALMSKDAAAIAKVTVSNDSNLEITAETVEPFVEFINERPTALIELVDDLENYGSHYGFRIEQRGKKLGLYDGYQLVVDPIYTTLYVNLEGTVVTLNGEEIATADKDSYSVGIGPLFPGKMVFEASGDVNGFPLTTTETVMWLEPNLYHEMNLYLSGYEFEISSDLADATVYLNDEEIGVLENGHGHFGPIQFEEGMEIHVEKAFEEESIISETIELDEYNSYYDFNNLVGVSSYDIQQLISNMYGKISNIASYSSNDSEVSELNRYFHADGPANEKQKTELLAYAQELNADDEVNRLYFNVEVTDYEQTSPTEFDVDYEVTYRVSYGWGSDKADTMKHYSKEATVLFEPTNHPDKEFEETIYEIKNEELLYEE